VPLWGENGEFRGYIGACVDMTHQKQTESELRDSEAQLRLAMQGAGLATWETDLQTGVSQWDDRLLALLGVHEKASETSGTWLDFIHASEKDRVLKEFTAACEGRGFFHTEFLVKHQNEAPRWFASWGHLVDGEQSKRMVGLVQNITARKQAEESLRVSEERLKSILNRAPAAIFIKDSAGRYLFMNEQCAQVLGVNQEQALGHTDHDLLPFEVAAPFMANDQHVWASERLLTVEEQVPQADGVHTSLVQKFLLRDKQGRPYALSGIALDITPRLRLEAAIQASEARLQLAQSAANIGVFDWDLVVQKGVWSPELARIWGLPVGGFDRTVETWRRLIHPDDLESAHAASQRALKDPTTASECEFRIIRPDGGVRWIYAKAKTLCNWEGRPVRIVGVNLDITDRKEAQLHLERLAQELEAQVEDRTRDLLLSQERLRALTGELNLAEQRERKRLATELHDHLQQLLVVGKLTIGQGRKVASGLPAYEAVLKKVDDILSDALAYSRTLVAELSPPVLRDQGLAASMKWLADYMKQKYEHTVTVIETGELALPLAEDQHVLLFQSARELLINSSKHAGTGQSSLTIEQRGDHVCLTVRDHGDGFDPATATSLSSGGISSKFGLFSIRERLRAQGGLFEIHSAPSKGTSAILVLPLDRSVAQPGAILNESPSISRGSPADTVPRDPSTIGVLLVDDHVMIRQGLRTMLEAYREIHVLGEAANGDEAITLARTLQPNVVLMDINMPERNGIEATAVIKQSFPQMAVVGLSVNADRANQDAMLQAGACILLTKEAPVEELYHAIKSASRTFSDRQSTTR